MHLNDESQSISMYGSAVCTYRLEKCRWKLWRTDVIPWRRSTPKGVMSEPDIWYILTIKDEEVRVSLFMSCTHKVGVQAQLHSFSISVAGGGEMSNTRPASFLPGKEPLYLVNRRPGVHPNRSGWFWKRKCLLPLLGFEPPDCSTHNLFLIIHRQIKSLRRVAGYKLISMWKFFFF